MCCSIPLTFSQTDEHSSLVTICCLSRTTRSKGGESLGSSQMSLGNAHVPVCTHTTLHDHGLLDLWEYVGVLQSPLWTCHFSAFLLPFFVCLLFSPAVIAALGNCSVKQLPLVIVNKHRKEMTISTGQTLSHISIYVYISHISIYLYLYKYI